MFIDDVYSGAAFFLSFLSFRKHAIGGYPRARRGGGILNKRVGKGLAESPGAAGQNDNGVYYCADCCRVCCDA